MMFVTTSTARTRYTPRRDVTNKVNAKIWIVQQPNHSPKNYRQAVCKFRHTTCQDIKCIMWDYMPPGGGPIGGLSPPLPFGGSPPMGGSGRSSPSTLGMSLREPKELNFHVTDTMA